jgi:hypothetical protein
MGASQAISVRWGGARRQHKASPAELSSVAAELESAAAELQSTMVAVDSMTEELESAKDEGVVTPTSPPPPQKMAFAPPLT